jgi:nitroalkane oxidase
MICPSHQAVGYALANAKMVIEAVPALSLRAARAFDTQVPIALELPLHARVPRSETAVRDLGPYACRPDRQLRSHAASRLLADATRVATVRWQEHGQRRQLHKQGGANAWLSHGLPLRHDRPCRN